MLVLSRRVGESIHIGDGIMVTVLESDGRTVRLGIRAPSQVSIHRSEVLERIQAENRKALATGRNLEQLAGFFRASAESNPGL